MTVLGPALVGLLVSGAGGALAPALVRRIPEPEESGTEGAGTEEAGAEASGAEDAGTVGTGEVPETKEPYAAIAVLPHLAAGCAAAAGAAGAAVGASLGWDWSLVLLLPLVPVLVALAVVDWRTRLLPTWVIKRAYVGLVALALVVAVLSGDHADLVRAGWGWLAAGLSYFVLWFVHPRGLGYGDVRLSGVLGIALGHLGWGELLVGLYSGFLLGGVGGGLLALVGLADRRGVPFGPFMVLGALVGVLVGPWAWGHLVGDWG